MWHHYSFNDAICTDMVALWGLCTHDGGQHEGHCIWSGMHCAKILTFLFLFVNPTQFGINEDLDAYPKTWNEDLESLINREGAGLKYCWSNCWVLALTGEDNVSNTSPKL